jgi:hypothetical protein
VREEDFQRKVNVKRMVENVGAGKRQRMELSKFWDAYFLCDKAKFLAASVYYGASRMRWEVRTWKWLQDVWSEGRIGDPTQSVDWSAANILYFAWIPGMRAEYIGETGRGLRVRVMQHAGKALAGKRAKQQKLHKNFSKFGVHRAIWVPVATW